MSVSLSGLWALSAFFLLIMILISVAFFTLLERKVLGYSHERMGPNKVGVYGLIQPMSDALKLFSKENGTKFKSQYYYFYTFSPLWGLFMSLLSWKLSMFWGSCSIYFMGAIVFFCISGFSAYFILMAGWSSLSKYSLIGSYRSSSQVISYEVVLIICLLIFCFTANTYDLLIYVMGSNLFLAIIFPSLMFIWAICCYAETNRSPFDFSEGESELVSGFNTEYMGGMFSLIFIGEYTSILFLSFLSGIMFFSGSLFFLFWGIMMSFSFLWVRCSFPRLRYDKLMLMCWKSLLVYTLSIFTLSVYLM